MKDSIAIVSGGSRGLGFELARQLAQAGAQVVICGRSQESLEGAREVLRSEGLSLDSAWCDVTDRESIERLVANVIERYGRIDLLINDAGVIEVGPLESQLESDFREAIETHLFGPLNFMNAVAPNMRARRSGRIVNVASIGGIVGVPHLAPYSASKFALVGLSQAAGAELAGDGISVTCACPSLMRTGSPGHAIFKGQNRKEAAWFTISDANPLLSMSARTAAKRILEAAMRNQPVLLLGWQSRVAALANGLAPNTVSFALRIANRLLPGPGGIGTQRRTGNQSQSWILRTPLTLMDRIAQRRYNQ